MSAFLTVLGRDLRLAARTGGDALTLVLFFVMAGAIMPFAIGPDRVLLQKLAPGIIWLAAFLSMLLGLDRLFRADEDDGTLLLFRHAGVPLQAIVFAKVAAHWLLEKALAGALRRFEVEIETGGGAAVATFEACAIGLDADRAVLLVLQKLVACPAEAACTDRDYDYEVQDLKAGIFTLKSVARLGSADNAPHGYCYQILHGRSTYCNP